MRVRRDGSKLNGPETAVLRDALLDTFDTPTSVEEFFALQVDRPINSVIAFVPGIDLKYLWFKAISKADAEFWSSELLQAARRVRPESSLLLQVAQRFGHGPEIEFVNDPASPLEVQVVAANSMFDPDGWRTRLGALEGRVCQVELNGRTGTGFLVGPRALMTNYHVLQPLLEGKVGPDAVALRFDFKWADGKFQPGTVFGLDADWKIDASPSSAVDEQPDQEGVYPDPDHLDYAVVRLAAIEDTGELPGNASLGNPAQTKPPPPPRGWVELPEGKYEFPKATALHILQHPGGQPLKVAFDTSAILEVDKKNGSGFNGNGTRVRYRTNTSQGSSGSPCFDANWNLIALHHAGDPSYPALKKAEYNQGIPIARIRERLGSKVAELAT